MPEDRATGCILTREEKGNYEVLSSPIVWARATACARVWTFSLVKMFLTCVFTVSGAMERIRAISLLDRPWAIRLSILPSRSLSSSSIAEGVFFLTWGS